MAALPKDGFSLHEVIAQAVKEALDKRLPTYAAVGLTPPRFVQAWVAALLTGYTEKAINAKMDEGVWVENREWMKAPDGRRLVDLQGYERWVMRGRPGDPQ
jgi:hypothetical protein